jgi:DNA-binding transcriptional ArsR family regulator
VLSIEFSVHDMARIRFALSCLWEVVASVRVLADPTSHAVHLPWVNRVRPQLAAAGFIPGSGDRLLTTLVPPTGRPIPDFLTPAPTALTADLDAELAVLRASPAERVRRDLGVLDETRSSAVRPLHDDPEAQLARLASEITEYWTIAIAPYWPRMRMLLEAEVFQRARRLTEDGAEGLLNDLHQRVRWEDDTLSIAHRYCTGNTTLVGSGLLLVPSVFVWPSVLSIAAAEQPQLAYPARGIGTLWEAGNGGPAALAAVLGRTRANLLAVLESPLSTTDLARRAGLSAGGISQHLGILRAAGLVTSHRAGHAVLNTRTPVAEALLSAAA